MKRKESKLQRRREAELCLLDFWLWGLYFFLLQPMWYKKSTIVNILFILNITERKCWSKCWRQNQPPCSPLLGFYAPGKTALFDSQIVPWTWKTAMQSTLTDQNKPLHEVFTVWTSKISPKVLCRNLDAIYATTTQKEPVLEDSRKCSTGETTTTTDSKQNSLELSVTRKTDLHRETECSDVGKFFESNSLLLP